MCVASAHMCPNGSWTMPYRSPQNWLRQREHRFRPGVCRLLPGGIHVRHVEREHHRSSAQRFRRAHALLGKCVGHHQVGIADLQVRVHDLAVGRGADRPHYFRAEYVSVKFDCLGRSVHQQVRRDAVHSIRNWFHHLPSSVDVPCNCPVCIWLVQFASDGLHQFFQAVGDVVAEVRRRRDACRAPPHCRTARKSKNGVDLSMIGGRRTSGSPARAGSVPAFSG